MRKGEGEEERSEKEKGKQKEEPCCHLTTQGYLFHEKRGRLYHLKIHIFWHKDYLRPSIFEKLQTQGKL